MAAKKLSKALDAKIVARLDATSSIDHAGLSFNDQHYVFIVKAKRGELWNCGFLKDETKSRVTPLFEVAEKLNTPHKEVCETVCRSIAAEWGILPHFLDVRYIGEDLDPAPKSLAVLFDYARKEKLSSVPVTSLFFSPTFQEAVANVAEEDGRGVMLRMTIDDFTDPEGTKDQIEGFLSTVKLEPENVDLLIDYGHRTSESEVIQLGSLHLALLPRIKSWRTLSIASASIPASISNMPMNVWHSQPRIDWLAWLAVRTQRLTRRLRIPTYADYGVRGISTGKPIQNTPAPNLRYTSDQIVLVRRGKKNEQQMRQIARQLVARPEFMGSTFSYGDGQIAARATDDSPNDGAAEHWILWCMNHHVEFVTHQLVNLP